MKSILTYALSAGIALVVLSMAVNADRYRLPRDQRGYEPDQPIAFSHRLHAGELGVDCQYCHSGAERSRHAGIPAVSTCLNCHKFIKDTWGAVQAEDKAAAEEKRAPKPVESTEIAKLLKGEPIVWNQVHKLPDFAYFDHRPHVAAGVACQKCHGPVETMEKVRQVESLSMGWCVNCHRDVNEEGVAGKPVHASTDCTTCHY